MKDDHQILQQIADGNELSFRHLYGIYGKMVYNLALSFCRDVPDAEIITQDVFVKVHRSAGGFTGGSTVKTWMHRITVNTSINHIKKIKRHQHQAIDSMDVAEPVHPGVLLEKQENSRYLDYAISTLPDDQRTAFVLSYIEDLPRQEVADIMDKSLKAVESLLMRAKQNLRKKLEIIYPHRRKK